MCAYGCHTYFGDDCLAEVILVVFEMFVKFQDHVKRVRTNVNYHALGTTTGTVHQFF